MNSREIAYQHIYASLVKRAYTNLQLKNKQLDGFTSKLIYTVVDQFEFLCFQFESFLHQPINLKGQIILAMLIAQKHFFDSVPDYANVNEAINLAKKECPKLAGLINAVGKKCVQQDLLYKQNGTWEENMSVNTSTPLWIVKLLQAQYGQAQTALMLDHQNSVPPLDINFHPEIEITPEMTETYQLKQEQNVWVANHRILASSLLAKGRVLIQDRNSQALLQRCPQPPLTSILDTCSGPGTKTVGLSIRYPMAQIEAIELYPHRAQLVKELAERWQRTNIQIKTEDFLRFESDQQYEMVFCDVPCSGLGVIRRKPDLKRNIQSQDLDSLQQLQAHILAHASLFVQNNGYLVYATCTLNKKENEKQIEHFLKQHPHFVCQTMETLFGHENGGDSFFMACLLKQEQL